jgi:hypothetical protein
MNAISANACAALPVAVIGGGPVGLAAAAHLALRGIRFRLYEAGDAVAANVRDWGHVRLFSTWQYNIDAAARGLLAAAGWNAPPQEALPTGADLYDLYLRPLAAHPALAPHIETQAHVTAIARDGFDKVKTQGREDAAFVLAIRNGVGPRRERARAVIDASGTWATPNPLGANGLPAAGEAEHASRIAYGIPDVLGAAAPLYAGKRVLVVGSGHSAANVLLDLARLAKRVPGTQITWAVRGARPPRAFGSGAADQLPARGQLGLDLQRLVASGALTVRTGVAVSRVETMGDGLIVRGRNAGKGGEGLAHLGPFDRIVVATGQRPDLDMTRELRLDLDPWLESTRALGPLIDPNVHSCGTVRPHGYTELQHLEPGFYTIGVKSYGRAPTFLLATGYEQARSVVAHIAGDEEAARKVELSLPETGVCSGPAAAGSAEAATSCCTTETPQGVCCPPKPELAATAPCCGA